MRMKVRSFARCRASPARPSKRVSSDSIVHFSNSNGLLTMGVNTSPNLKERRQAYETEKDQTDRWFFQRIGLGCGGTRHQHPDQHDRQHEFPESAGRYGNPEDRNRDIL